jgi:hypothetical protein
MRRLKKGKDHYGETWACIVIGPVFLIIPVSVWMEHGWQFDPCTLFFAALGLNFFVGGIWNLVRRRLAKGTLRRAEVNIEPDPPRIGGELRVQVKQMALAGLSIEAMVARLWCEEWKNFNVSETGRARTETVFDQQQTLLDARDVTPGTEITGEGVFALPGDLKNSFVRGDHSVEWRLEVRTRVRRWPDAILLHELNVKAAPGQREEESEEE